MAAWLFVKPLPPHKARSLREEYLERVEPSGEPVHTPHAICAKRFASAGVARRWASQYGELLADYTVARR